MDRDINKSNYLSVCLSKENMGYFCVNINMSTKLVFITTEVTVHELSLTNPSK